MDNSGHTGHSVTKPSLDSPTEEGIITSPSRPSETSPRLSVRTRKVLIFILTSFVYFLNWCCVGMWSPFFPGEAEKRGISSTEVGFIFGTYSLVAFLTSLFYGPILIPRIGPYFVLFAGLFVNGGANVVCGFVNLIQDAQVFSIYCFIVRSVGALGGAACETAIVVILTQEFQDNLSTVIGLLEVFTGLGFIVGPVLGGVLYSFGGFKLPFIVIGGFLLVTLPFIYWILPRKEHVQPADTGSLIKQAITIPGVAVTCMACFVVLIALSVFDPTLEPHANKMFGLNSTGVSLLFLCLSGSYMVSAPITGYILSKKPLGRTFIVIGSLGMVGSTFFMGPPPFLTSFVPTKQVWVLVVCLAILGISCGIFFVPILPEMLQCFHERGLPKGLMADSLASGLYTGFSNLGSFVGPVAGGILNEYFGFPWTCTIVAFLVAGQTVILAAFFTCSRRGSSASITGTERQPLIDDHATQSA